MIVSAPGGHIPDNSPLNPSQRAHIGEIADNARAMVDNARALKGDNFGHLVEMLANRTMLMQAAECVIVSYIKTCSALRESDDLGEKVGRALVAHAEDFLNSSAMAVSMISDTIERFVVLAGINKSDFAEAHSLGAQVTKASVVMLPLPPEVK